MSSHFLRVLTLLQRTRQIVEAQQRAAHEHVSQMNVTTEFVCIDEKFLFTEPKRK